MIELQARGRTILMRDGVDGPMRRIDPDKPTRFYRLDAEKLRHDSDVMIVGITDEPDPEFAGTVVEVDGDSATIDVGLVDLLDRRPDALDMVLDSAAEPAVEVGVEAKPEPEKRTKRRRG